MEYTVQKLAALAGVSARTLRYYNQIGLLLPLRQTEAGYRIYGPGEVDRLQQILFYRALGLELERIRDVLDAPEFDELAALRQHREQLRKSREQLDLLLDNVEKTLQAKEGRSTMSDKEKFQGFKEHLVEENEAAYGQEIRQRYGDEAVDASNWQLMGLSEGEYNQMKQLETEVLESLDMAFAQGDPCGELAWRTAQLHHKWLGYSWATYTPQAHAALAQMYVDDNRFAAYYNRGSEGKAAFLRDAVLHYTNRNS